MAIRASDYFGEDQDIKRAQVLIEEVARRCAEIALETRTLSRADRQFHADPSDIKALMGCAYREVAAEIMREFGLSAPPSEEER